MSEDDAVLAIMLYEESITARVGMVICGLYSTLHFDENLTSVNNETPEFGIVYSHIHNHATVTNALTELV